MMRLYLLIPFQSTLPRGERRKRAGIRTNDINISIHAPTRGATSDCGGIPVGVVISIHAPTRGATTDKGLSTIEEVISIHAPTRGATYQTRRHRNGFTDFNPRSHEGSDSKYYLFLLYQSSFLKQYSQISIFSNYTNIESTILIRHFPGANLSDISC